VGAAARLSLVDALVCVKSYLSLGAALALAFATFASLPALACGVEQRVNDGVMPALNTVVSLGTLGYYVVRRFVLPSLRRQTGVAYRTGLRTREQHGNFFVCGWRM
jgi:hypothetical protein